MDPWWTGVQAGLLGGIVGGLGGLVGIFGGVAGGILVPRGIAKRTVLTVMATLAALGLVTLVVGAFAAIAGQPHHVYSGMLVAGTCFYCVCGCLIPSFLARYRVADAMRAAGLAPNERGDRAIEVLVVASEQARNDPRLRRWRRCLFLTHLAVAVSLLVLAVAVLLAKTGHGWVWASLGCFVVLNALFMRFEHLFMRPDLVWPWGGRMRRIVERRRLDVEELRRS